MLTLNASQGGPSLPLQRSIDNETMPWNISSTTLAERTGQDVSGSYNASTTTSIIGIETGENELIGLIPADAWTEAFTYIFIVGYGTCIWTGTIGNFLCVVVMLRNRLRSASTTAFLVPLAVADTLTLYAVNQRDWFHRVFGRPLVNDPCNLMFATAVTTSTWSSWCMVCVTVERFVAVRFPLQAASINKPVRARITMVILPIVLILIIGVPNFLMLRQEGKDCVTVKEFEFFSSYVASPYWGTLRVLLPGTIVFALNSAIVHELRRMKANLKESISARSQSDARSKDVRKITVMVLTVSTAYLILCIPLAVWFIILDTRGADATLFNHSPTMATVGITLELLTYLNHSSNFFLYVVSSPKFRLELLGFLSCGRYKQRSLLKHTESGRGRTRMTTATALPVATIQGPAPPPKNLPATTTRNI